jgi:hypothetical protein
VAGKVNLLRSCRVRRVDVAGLVLPGWYCRAGIAGLVLPGWYCRAGLAVPDSPRGVALCKNRSNFYFME